MSARWIVHGEVQGVGFRHFTKVRARELRLRGDVRNLRDGTVEIRVSGPAAAVAELRDRVSSGPPAAVVRGVETAGLDETDLPEPFSVRF